MVYFKIDFTKLKAVILSIGMIISSIPVASMEANFLAPPKAVNDEMLKAFSEALTSEELMIEIEYIMNMLGITDYPRIIQIFRKSMDKPVAFVKELQKLSGKKENEILSILDKIDFFRPLSLLYRVKNTKTFPSEEFADNLIRIGVTSHGLTMGTSRLFKQGLPISDYLQCMRESAQDVPFVFRDDMEKFVGRFMGQEITERDTPDLTDIINQIKTFFKGIDLDKIKYLFSSGIGANEMYSHQLAAAVNAYFASREIKFKWIVVNNPDHLKKIPKNANNNNTIVFEMSRSGKTKETIDFFNATKDRFKKRIVVANEEGLNKAARTFSEKSDTHVLIIDNTPGDIGGRQMNRKTLMVYAPLFIALASGFGEVHKSEEYLRTYCQALLDANNKLAYKNESNSAAIRLAEFLFRHRESGRNKFSVIYDNSLRGVAKELFQLMNEGANKGDNVNILDFYSLTDDKKIYNTVFNNAADSQLSILLFNTNSKNSDKVLSTIKSLKQKRIPIIVIPVNLDDDEYLSNNLKTLARTSALFQDMVVYFTYITNQDANSNPAVKFVREITAAMFEIIKKKKANGITDIRISFEEVLAKIEEKQKAKTQKAKEKIDKINVKRQSKDNPEFHQFKKALRNLAEGLNVSETSVVEAVIKTTSQWALIDIGEAGKSDLSDSAEAFSRSKIGTILGMLVPSREIPALGNQVILEDTERIRVSVALEKDRKMEFSSDSLSEKIAQYLFEMYKERQKDLGYMPLTYMEADENNPIINAIVQNILDTVADLNITSPLLPLPNAAHTGIEAIMSHLEKVLNIAIIYTNNRGGSLGKKAVEKGITKQQEITVDDCTYVYGTSNVLRMPLGGAASIIFEVKNKNDLPFIQKTLQEALAIFKKRLPRKMTLTDDTLQEPNSNQQASPVKQPDRKSKISSSL